MGEAGEGVRLLVETTEREGGALVGAPRAHGVDRARDVDEQDDLVRDVDVEPLARRKVCQTRDADKARPRATGGVIGRLRRGVAWVVRISN